ncbi:nucleotidyltransferase domain-containing protein [candidate division KSB1 bacterium]|nr:nucleotidyltransferase domain-containing protein [candidate division KSB1 bacterium]
MERSEGKINLRSEKLTELLAGYPVETCYLFGSYARDDEGPLSDIDLAVFFDESLDKPKCSDLRLRLIGEIQRILKTDRLDLVDLNSSPLALHFKAIKEGKILFCRDELKRIRKEVRIMSLYFDRQYYDRRHIKNKLERIVKEGIL